MSNKKRVLVFAASGSKSSINFQLVKWATQYLTPFEFTVVDFANFVVDKVYCDNAQTQGPVPALVNDFRTLIETHDAVLVSFSENNFGPTAAWKNMLDWLTRTVPGSDPMNDWKKTFGNQKPWCILGTSPSPMGSQITVENASKHYSWLGAKVVGSATLPSFYKNFKDGQVTDMEQAEKLKTEVLKLVAALQ